MNIRTKDEFFQILDEEFAWRQRELDAASTALMRATGKAKDALLRSLVPLLYAHWEGFIKAASERILDYVRGQKLRYELLNSNFLALGLGRSSQFIMDASHYAARVAAIRDIFEKYSSETFLWTGKINTKSNLSSKVFISIASIFGFNIEQYRTRFAVIDDSLLNPRNTIAHGNFLEIQEDGFLSLRDNVLEIMKWFKTDAENFVVSDLYLKNQVSKLKAE